MKRLLTAAVGVPLALAAIFRLPGWAFFLVCAVLLEWAALELVALARGRAPRAPWALLLLLVPLVGAALAWSLGPAARPDGFHLLALATALSVLVGSAVLFARTPVEESLYAAGAIGFGTLYFAAPMAALYRLQQHDPWVLFLLLAIVWLGDTAAYYVGSAWGRHKLAPLVSPNKSWEGAAAGLVTSLVATLVWSLWRLERIDWALVAIALATALAGQVGDLVESLWKRGVGVKDSGGVLPGHGGVLDRMDSMLFAAPTLLVLLWLCGYEVGP
jgi:phosphatidate cytidylyltransferase